MPYIFVVNALVTRQSGMAISTGSKSKEPRSFVTADPLPPSGGAMWAVDAACEVGGRLGAAEVAPMVVGSP